MPIAERHCCLPPLGLWAMVLLIGLLLVDAALAVVTPPVFGEESSRLPRHPLERAALTDPEGSLLAINQALGRPDTQAQPAQLALLQLARANACRVMGDWHCQRQAGAAAADAAAQAPDTVLRVRGMIAEARGAMSLDDMVYGERILAQAELVLQGEPNSELTADIQLAYSSMSYRLGRHQAAMVYAQRGLDALVKGEALPMRVRLLRNLARAKLQLADFDGVELALREALQVPLRPEDPKLLAEIHLELARLARRQDDIEGQRQHGRTILEIAGGLENTQLAGLGHEVLANAAQDTGDTRLAQAELRKARDHFASLDLASDELRVIPGLLRLERDPAQISSLALRMLELEQQVDEVNRAQATADFDIRLQHAQQEMALAQLQASSELSQTRLNALRERNRLFLIILLLVLLLACTLAWVLVNQRRSNRRLQEVLESRQRALLITSHELRNPIAGVVGLADLLLRSQLSRQQQDMVRALMSAAESVGQLSQDLLDRGRAESGELRLSPHPVALGQLAGDLEQLYAVQARSKGIGFKLELDQSLPESLLVDGERLQQVLINLLSNALKFTEKGQIGLRIAGFKASLPGYAGVRFEVGDTGAGLSAADQERLFEPFSKGRLGQAHSFGAGLGLSICRDLVHLMGGEIKVDSELGQGTRMAFALQLQTTESTRPAQPATKEASERSAVVLVVDDDPDLQLLYAAQLQALGCEVESVDSGKACRQRCEERSFDLIVLDDHLGFAERGSEIAKTIVGKDGWRPRVVVVSGNLVPDELPEGVDEWIIKPMRMDHIGRIIDAVKNAKR